MKVVDVPRPPRKRLRGAQVDDGPQASRLTAYCLVCRRCTGMRGPARRESHGVAITSGRCADCGGEVYRVGSVYGVHDHPEGDRGMA